MCLCVRGEKKLTRNQANGISCSLALYVFLCVVCCSAYIYKIDKLGQTKIHLFISDVDVLKLASKSTNITYSFRFCTHNLLHVRFEQERAKEYSSFTFFILISHTIPNVTYFERNHFQSISFSTSCRGVVCDFVHDANAKNRSQPEKRKLVHIRINRRLTIGM